MYLIRLIDFSIVTMYRDGLLLMNCGICLRPVNAHRQQLPGSRFLKRSVSSSTRDMYGTTKITDFLL